MTSEPLQEDWAMEILWRDARLFTTIQLFSSIISIPTVYGIFYCIEKYLNDQWSLIAVLLLSLALFSLAVVSNNIINYYWILPYLYPDRSFKLVFEAGSHLYHAFNLGALIGVACAIKLVRKQLRSKINEQILIKEKVITELKFLKAQINPHFLFNTLNNIYSLARKESKETPEVILKLSKLMRFMLYEASSPTILLSDELKLIEDYIALEKIRYSDRLRVEFRTDLDNPYQKIAPLLLIHFVENAFKHGASESRFDSYIFIHIELKRGTLFAEITNTTEENQQSNEAHAIGLNNMKRQLELLYPKHTLTLRREDKRFTIQLIIPLL